MGSNPLSSTGKLQFIGDFQSCVGDDVTDDVTLRVVASIHAQKNRAGNTYRVLWRHDGRQQSLTFENLPAAERFKTLLEDHGPDEALRIIERDEIGRHVPTVTEWLQTHIDNLTGVQPATLARYRTYVARDIDPVFGMFESDYPHSDSNWPHTRKLLAEHLVDVPDDEARKIVELNARTLYRFWD
jgi:hypothetical protein